MTFAEWCAAYQHGLDNNTPRTQTELAALMAIVAPLLAEDEQIQALAHRPAAI